MNIPFYTPKIVFFGGLIMQNANILIVDDEPDTCQLYKKILMDLGESLNILTVNTSSEAISIVEMSPIDVLVADIILPGLNGLELTQLVKNIQKDTQVIIITGYDEVEHAVESLRLGASTYLTKPVRGEILFYAVKNALEKKQEITNHKSALKALQESENKYRAIFNHMNDGVAVYDVINDGEDFIFADFNPAAEEMDKIRREHVIGKSVLEIFPAIREFGLFEVFQRVYRTGVPEYHPISEYKDNRISAWRKNYVCKLSDKQIVAIYSDETTRKQYESFLFSSEKRYRTLFDNAGDALFVHDFESFFQDVNELACQKLGYTRQELLKLCFKDIVTPECARAIPQLMESLKKDGHFVFEGIHVRKNGDTFPFEGNSRVIDYDGKLAVMTISRDISERKKAEEEQKKLRQLLRQAQKMEALGALAGGIAHDFNNILFPIVGYTEMAYEELPPQSKARTYLSAILKASERAGDLIRQILTFSRETEHEPKPLKIQVILKETIKLLRASLPANIELRFRMKETGPILADAAQMHQVIMNLCTNAFHAMEEKGGVIDICLDTVKLDEMEVKGYVGLSPGEYIKLTVSDTGCGMSPEIIERIFDPYFTTKEKGKGTGLGLSIVHGIIKSHHGHISVYSEVGKGSTFHIYLPLLQCKVDMAKIEDQPGLEKGTERVLLVDDEKPIVDMLNIMLSSLGYQVTYRTSSIEALEAFKYQPHHFDIVLTDAFMPNMTGLELAKEILKIRADIPIVLFSGYSETTLIEKAKKIGIREVIMKPVIRKNLAATIRKALSK